MSLQQVKFNALRSIANGSISTMAYTAVGTAIALEISMFRITNTTDSDQYISTDGSTDMLYVPASSFVLYDISSNRSINQSFYVAGNTQFYVKAAGSMTKGGVFIESISPNIQTPALPL